MPQHDLILDNGSGAAFRADANNALAALGSSMKGPNAPPAPIAGLMWLDDDTPSASLWTLKMYDGADWIEIGRLNVTTNVFTVAEGSFAPVDIASAATTDIGSSASPNVRITGTTTITSFGTVAAGTRRFLAFAAALTLTHNATSLILPGAANIITAAGDMAVARSLGSGNWVIESFTRAAGLPVAQMATARVLGRATSGTGAIEELDAAAARTVIGVSDQWVQLASANITAVSQIDLTWTGGAYLFYKIFILGLKPGAATNNDLFLRVRRNGTFLAGAADYNLGDSWWNGTAVGNQSGAGSYSLLAQAGMNGEPMFGEANLMQAANTERIVIDSKTRHTSNTPAHSRSIFTANTDAGSGWLDGARISFVGSATNFAAVGKIVVLGMKS
jgi:hypothetical protein